MESNLVIQLEIFHVNLHQTDMAGIVNEAFERLEDGMRMAKRGADISNGIKTVIRFYDANNFVASCLQRLVTHRAKWEIWADAPRKNFLTNGWARWQIARIQKRIDNETEQIRAFAQTQLQRTRTSSTVVAVEKTDFHFRLIKSNEWHDLIQQIRFGNIWVFAFKPTDLLQVDGLHIVSSYR